MGQLTIGCALLLVAVAAGCDSGGSSGSQATTAPAAVPRMLADGSRPEPLPVLLRRFRGRSVVGARELRPGSVPPPSGCLDPATRRKATFSLGWLSTDGLTREYVIEGAPGLRLVACDAIRHDGRWLRCGLAHASTRDPASIEAAGGGLRFVCDDVARPTSFMWVAPPRATAWALVDHRSHWTAYRSKGRRVLRVSRSGRAFRVHVVYLDRGLDVVRDRIVVGAVAG